MKQLLKVFSLVALTTCTVNAQENTENSSENGNYNKWSIDVNAGLSKPTAPFSVNYYAANTNFIHGDLGVRYMFNNKFGLKLDFGLDSFKNKSESNSFDGKYYRSSLQGVVNLGRVLSFEDWTQRLNLQAHSGLGFSFMTNDNFDGNDDMTNFILGLTAQYKISNRVALNADFSMINNVNQQYTFDGYEDPAVKEDRGFNSTLYNFSLGLSIYLGKNKTHADWYVVDKDAERYAALEKRVADLEVMLNDTDRDGVPDYLDVEPNTMAGIDVDTKGRGIDLNKNGVPESVDDLRFHDFLSISERDQSSVLLKLQHHNEDMVTHIRPRFVSNNGEIIHQLAIDGHGIILRSVWDVVEELISGQLQHVLPAYWQDADIWAVYPSRLKTSSKLQTCILFIQHELSNRLLPIQSLKRGEVIAAAEHRPPPTEKVFL